MQIFRLLLLASVALPAFADQESEPEAERESFEAEFVASDIFRSGSVVVPFARRLSFEGHYFGGKETDVGYTGISWVWESKGLKLAPGFGASFGTNKFTASPAVSFRWEYEKGWFIAQGLSVQSFRETPIFAEEGEPEEGHAKPEPVGYVRPYISDGNHVSARWRRITVGGTWEHIAFREGTEWKGGGRLAVRILPRVSAILYVLTPGRTEWRGGILIHASKEK